MPPQLRIPASDLRQTLTQPETNADRSRGFVQTPHPSQFRSLSDGAFRQYQWLLSYAWNGERCWPSMRRLAEDQGVDVRTVRTRMRELEAEGFVESEARGPGKGNVYNLRKTVSAGEEVGFRGGRKESSSPCEVDVRDVEAVKHTATPPPPPRSPKADTAGGGGSRLRYSTADRTPARKTTPAQAVRDPVAYLTHICKLEASAAEDLATGLSVETVQLAWRYAQEKGRDPVALLVHRLRHKRKEHEEEARWLTQYDRDTLLSERKASAAEAHNEDADRNTDLLAETDPALYSLLCPPQSPFALDRVEGCSDWFQETVIRGSCALRPGVDGVRCRVNPVGMAQAFVTAIREGRVPEAAIARTREALEACYSPALSPLFAQDRQA